MNQNSKRKAFDNRDLFIEPLNQNEICYPKLIIQIVPDPYTFKKQNRNRKYKMHYFPIGTDESIKGSPKIYLATEGNEIIKENNKNDNNCYIKKELNNNITKLKKSIKIRSINDKKENIHNNKIIGFNREVEYENKENIQPNNHTYINKIEIEPNKKKCLNHSLSVDNYLELNNKLLLNFHQNLEKSQILEEKFIKGIKSVKRKNNLLNAIEKYKRFKSFGKLNINNNLNNNFKNKYDFNNSTYNINNQTERIKTFNTNNQTIIDEENKSNLELKKERKVPIINEINNIHITNKINLDKLNNNIQSKKELNKDLTSFLINHNKKYYIKNIRNKINPNNNNINKNNNKIKKPQIIIKRILREEHYLVDENGKETLVDVNQSFLPKKINVNKLNEMNKLNLNLNNNKINIDDEIIKKEKYKAFNNNKIKIHKKKLIKINTHNSFKWQKKKSLDFSAINNNKSINGNILSFLKQKERPILFKNMQNKIEKKKELQLNEINNLGKSFINGNKQGICKTEINNINKNHVYHEINSLERKKEKEKSLPTQKSDYVYDKNKKNFFINNSSRQTSLNNNNFVFYPEINNMNNYNHEIYKVNNKENKNEYLNNNYETERYLQNYSIHEIIDIKNKNRRNNYLSKYSKTFEETKNENTIYVETSPNSYHNYQNIENIPAKYYKYKKI